MPVALLAEHCRLRRLTNSVYLGCSGDLEIGHGINLLRPETVESLFVLWRLTHDRR